MKKHLSLILRILFAAAGIAYIAWSLTWMDQVIVPAGTKLPDGSVLAEATSMRVVSGDLDPNHVTGPLTVLVDLERPDAGTLVVQPSQLGEEITDYRLKPGVPTTLRHANLKLLLLGLLLVGPIYPIQSVRWWLLMRCRGLEVALSKAFQLTMVGSFFNYCMPGTTGGDVVKAYYAAARSDRRAVSIMSVIFDRIAGLLGLVLLGGVAGLFMLAHPVARTVTMYIWLCAGAITLGSAVYFSKRLRPLLGVDWLLGRLPAGGMLSKVDEAAVAYRDHKLTVLAAILLSVPVHLMLTSATALAGFALGMDTGKLGLLLTVVPVLFLAGSVPLTYQGLGVMEGLAMAMLLDPPQATPNQIVGMLLMIRLYQVAYSLLGSLYLLKGDVHMHPERTPEPVGEPVSQV